MKYQITGLCIALSLYLVGVYLSGVTLERGSSAVFIYIFAVLSSCAGFIFGEMYKLNKSD